MFSSFVARMRDLHFLLGPRGFFRQTVKWSLVREFSFFRLDLEMFSPYEPIKQQFDFSEYSQMHLPVMLAMNSGLSEKHINDQLNTGKKCVLGWIGKEPVVYRWQCDCITRLDFLGLDFVPDADQICITETYVPMQNRKRGIYKTSAIQNYLRLKEQGYKSVIGFAASWHAPTRHLLLDILGYEEVGSVVVYPLAPFGRFKLKGQVMFDSEGRLTLAGRAVP